MDRYNRKGVKGSVTVFLSLSCILFLCVICGVIESARVQGAKAQTANCAGMGTFSILGEFERDLLEEYEIFGLDGAYGSGSFQISKVNDQLFSYLSYNAEPKLDLFSFGCFDPWNLELTEHSVSKYALLTDHNGESFYQQAVSYMKTNLGAIALDRLLDYAKKVDQIQEEQENYEKTLASNEKSLVVLEKKGNEKKKELESEAAKSGDGESETDESSTALVVAQPIKNPLPAIRELRKKSALEIVTWDKTLSDRSVNNGNFPSKGVSKKGTLEIDKPNSGGLIDHVLFREYLMMYFPNFLSEKETEGLKYQVEYILGGKNTDVKNLKYVVKRLLLMREAMNYMFCTQDGSIQYQTGLLATSLTGFLGMPALTTATQHALMLAWAYGESLVDVRILLNKGKVPLYKNASNWILQLERLADIVEILKQGTVGHNEGMTYKEYLRILLNMGSIRKQKLRGLDMIQAELKQKKDTGSFKAENMIVAVETETDWKIHPVFYSLPKVIMGTAWSTPGIRQNSVMAY